MVRIGLHHPPFSPSVFGDSRRITRNPRVYARFAIARGPRERFLRRYSLESSQSYPRAILLCFSPAGRGIGFSVSQSRFALRSGGEHDLAGCVCGHMDISKKSSSAFISRSTLDCALGCPAVVLARLRPAMPKDLAAPRVRPPVVRDRGLLRATLRRCFINLPVSVSHSRHFMAICTDTQTCA